MKFALTGALAVAAVALSAGSAAADPCSVHHSRGEYNIPRGASNYHANNDRDRDGIACESGDNAYSPSAGSATSAPVSDINTRDSLADKVMYMAESTNVLNENGVVTGKATQGEKVRVVGSWTQDPNWVKVYFFAGGSGWVSRSQVSVQQRNSSGSSSGYAVAPSNSRVYTLRDVSQGSAIGKRVCPIAPGTAPAMATRFTTTYKWGQQIGKLTKCGIVQRIDNSATHVDIKTSEGWMFRVDRMALTRP